MITAAGADLRERRCGGQTGKQAGVEVGVSEGVQDIPHEGAL